MSSSDNEKYTTTSSSSSSEEEMEVELPVKETTQKRNTKERKDSQEKERGKESSEDEELPYEVENIPEYEKPSEMTLGRFFHIILFRSAWKQIIKGTKSSLQVSDMNPIPRTLEIENYSETLKHKWEEEHKTGKNRLFRVLFKMEWKNFFLSFITGAIYEIFSLGYPLMASFIVKWLNNPDAKMGAGVLFIILALIFQVIVCFGQEFSRKWIFMIALRYRNGLINLIYDKALRLNSAGIDQPGRLVNLMSNDAAIFLGHLEYSILGLACPLMLIILFFLIFNNMGSITWIPLVSLLGFIVFNMVFGFLNGFLFKFFTFKKDSRITQFNEILRNIKFIKYNNWEKPMQQKLKGKRFWEELWVAILGFCRGTFYTTTIEIGPCLSIILFSVMVNKNMPLELASVVTTISLFNSIRVPIRTVGICASAISAIQTSLKRITQFLCTPELDPMPVESSDSKNAIEMKDVEYKFPNGEIAFKCDELKIKKGELVCVLGSVGSGKSSFLLSALNELEKSKGETTLNGKITYSSQTAWLMNATVRENICFLKPFNKELYNQCVKDACLTTDLENLIGGDQYVVAEKGANLSGGQRQRIALARSLYNQQDIMLLDDPLSAVDFKVGSYIFENAINNNLKNRTRIVVTNQTYFIEKADKILVVDNNEKIFFGTLKELQKLEIEASEFVKTLTGSKTVKNEVNEEVASGDSLCTHTKEEKKERGRVGLSVYLEYLKCALVIPFLVFLVFLGMRITALWYYNYYMTAWGKSILPKKGLPTGKKDFFDGFMMFFGIDCVFIWCTEMLLIIFCLIASHNLHKKTVGKLMKTNLQYFDQTPMGRVLNLFSRDAQQVDYGLPYFIEPIIVNISTIVVTSIAMINMTAYLSIFVVVFIIIFVIVYTFIVTPVIEMQRLEGITRSPMFTHFDQTLLGLATIRTANGQEKFKNKLIDRIKNNTMSFYTCKMAKLWYLQRMDWIGAAVTIVATVFMVVAKATGGVDTAVAGNALTNITNIPTTFSILGTALIEVESFMQSAERIMQLNKLKNEENDAIKHKYREVERSWPEKGKIEFKDMSFRYRKDLPLVLKNVKAVIDDKEKIGVVGRTGSGKSTLMASIFRIANPANGSIIIDGKDITTIPLDTLRSRMCILPQEATMFMGTVRYNLDPFGLSTDEKMKHVLELVGCTRELDDIILEGGENVSMGERQLICLARALLKGSKILIMDEATANIDIQTDQSIQEMVRENFAECTVITVAHRLQTIMDSDRVMVFDDGQLKENEKPLKLIEEKTTIFNSLVQQSGCAEELERLARGEGKEKKEKQSNKKEEKKEKKSEKKEVKSEVKDEKKEKKEKKENDEIEAREIGYHQEEAGKKELPGKKLAYFGVKEDEKKEKKEKKETSSSSAESSSESSSDE